ncbi:MAG: isopenicillin N synthase family dioxygenase [Rhizobiaceae bacterium]
MSELAFPVFDLETFESADAAQQSALAAQVDEICRATGFLAISGHGMDKSVIDGIWAATRAFFDLDAESKNCVRAPYPGYPYGYLGPGSEALAKSKNVDTPPDLKESFNGGPLSIPPGLDDEEALSFCYAETIWPQRPEGFRQAWEAYYRGMEGLAARIMRVFALALDLPEDYFASYIDQPISALRALNYPHQEGDIAKPGQLRAGAHSDYGSLTILLPEPGTAGLQIFSPSGEWIDVPPIKDAFVINIGDLMARWTNDRWVSTLHRVVNPNGASATSNRRQSLAFFHQPNWFAEISCLGSCLNFGEAPKYEPVLSGPYLMDKFRSTVS